MPIAVKFPVLRALGTPYHPDIAAAMQSVALTGSVEVRGAVFTRKEVVEFILDLTGYTENQKLFTQRVLEPSAGHADFLLPIITRLISSWRKFSGQNDRLLNELSQSIYAVELHENSYGITRRSVIDKLISEGISMDDSATLADHWLHQGDFLLESIPPTFDYVVGNPPYVRQELIAPDLLNRYRRLFSTLYDRADLYIPFIEKSLRLLKDNGRLGFICADRWMKNRYGGPLREFVSQAYHLDTYVDMTDTDAFHSDVSAYPAVTVIRKGTGKATRIAHRPAIEGAHLKRLSISLTEKTLAPENPLVQQIFNVINGFEPWLLESSDQLDLLRRLESTFPTLEETGCKVGIGVATGADKVFTGKLAAFDIEPDRLIPLIETKDIRSGEIDWQGKWLINPFGDDGKLVPLENYSKLSKYFNRNKSVLTKRHCAQKSPNKWYRTIDRIWPALTTTPKLLIPDIKGEAHVVYDEGHFYPHHNLYYVISKQWHLRALQAVLLSRVSKLFITSYSTKMRGGYLRFQAQYLRRIRIPYCESVPIELRMQLIQAAESLDIDACNKAVFRLYGLNHNERSALGGNGE